MCNNKIIFFISFCLLILNSVFAEDKVMVFGGKSGWPQLSKMDGVTKGSGKFGYDCIQLDTESHNVDDNTDLLLDFESTSRNDSSGNYTVVKDDFLQTEKSVMGKGAALSRGTGGLELQGSKGSVFGTSGNTGSFTIDFWLSPSIAENGEVVFSWRSSRTVANYAL